MTVCKFLDKIFVLLKNGGEHLDSGSPPFTFYIIR